MIRSAPTPGLMTCSGALGCPDESNETFALPINEEERLEGPERRTAHPELDPEVGPTLARYLKAVVVKGHSSLI